MTPKQKEAVITHGNQLNAIFHTGLDPLTLCKKLRRIESAATKHTTAYCNGEITDIQLHEQCNKIWVRLDHALGNPVLMHYDTHGNKQNALFINLDPRGYALKIDDEYIRAHNIQLHRDWGGYGILAPEFGKDGE